MSFSSSHSRADSARSKVFLDRGNAEYVYEGCARRCKCGLKAPRYTSWTDKNPGRRFYGCGNFGKKDYKGEALKTCNFIEWHDEPMSSRAHDVILELKGERDSLKLHIASLLKQNTEAISGSRDQWRMGNDEMGIEGNDELMSLQENDEMRSVKDRENDELRYVKTEILELKEGMKEWEKKLDDFMKLAAKKELSNPIWPQLLFVSVVLSVAFLMYVLF